MKKAALVALLALTVCGCGSGSGDSISVMLSDAAGGWNGYVDLYQNGCPREIPDQAKRLYFTHAVTLQSAQPGFSDVTLEDGVGPCLAQRVANDSNTFLAVCPERRLVDFISGYECSEELVWQYTVEDASGTAQTNPVVRTAYVRCRQSGVLQFACPVEYRGGFGRCIRDLCSPLN